MGRWDNKNQNDKKGLNSPRLLIVLVAFLVSFWMFYGVILMMNNEPSTCAAIHDYIGSEDYFNLPSDERQRFVDADRECNRDSVIVR